MPGALHSKLTPKWGTPKDIATRSRIALGGKIDLDPASSPEFNVFVGAVRILTETDNGIISEWNSHQDIHPFDFTVFLNPPGGLVKEFWERLLLEYREKRISSAIWIGFSVEQLCILQDAAYYPLDFTTVILRKRLAFTRETGESGGSPSHGNYISGLGIDREIFHTMFGDLGKIQHGSASNP